MPSVRTFVVSDTHFSHEGVCKFLRNDGTKLRPWDDAESMNEDMVRYWNDTVLPTDKVYHVGDVAFKKAHLRILNRLNGDKVLIKGNHDNLHLKDYRSYFRDIRGCHVLNKYILAHIPIHPNCKGKFRGQLHGHLHSNVIHLPDGTIDPWYLNICVEHTDFRPILLDEAFRRIEQQQEEARSLSVSPCLSRPVTEAGPETTAANVPLL